MSTPGQISAMYCIKRTTVMRRTMNCMAVLQRHLSDLGVCFAAKQNTSNPQIHFQTGPLSAVPGMWSCNSQIHFRLPGCSYGDLIGNLRQLLSFHTLACLQAWIDEMSKYLKKADPNHMITVGEEGFYTKGSTGEAVNPGTGWASLTGQDFIANHASPAIDFAAAHIWPDNWEVSPLLVRPSVHTPSCPPLCPAFCILPYCKLTWYLTCLQHPLHPVRELILVHVLSFSLLYLLFLLHLWLLPCPQTGM